MGRDNQFLRQAYSPRNMPGHIKKTSGPDPDPSPWLAVSPELKAKNKAKPYDPKKSVWVPNKADGGYLEGMLESKDGNKVTVSVGGEKKVFKEDAVCQINPPKFDCSEDMADLTYLGDACVLWNSVVRYKNELIYTYSGLFCIAINPYKRLSWPQPRAALVRPPRPSRGLSARPRSWPSPRVRTRRTRTACLSWPASCRARSRPTSSRLRRPRRLLPSTWPSSARRSRSWRRPRREPSLPL